MRFLCGSILLGGVLAVATGCTDVPPVTDAQTPQEDPPPGADIAPEDLPYAPENEEVSPQPMAPGEPVAPDEGTGLRPSRFQESEESPASEFPQLEEQPQENAPNLLDRPADETSRSDFLETSNDLAFPSDSTR